VGAGDGLQYEFVNRHAVLSVHDGIVEEEVEGDQLEIVIANAGCLPPSVAANRPKLSSKALPDRFVQSA
jgi:hypothetical protein